MYMRRAGGGKQKGANFEREVCRSLSKWLTQGQSDSVLWRSAMSGGRSTVALKKGEQAKAQAGDLSGIDVQGVKFISLYTVECKFYKDLQFTNAVYGGASGLINFWNQACFDADAYKKQPLLIAKQNYKPALIGMRREVVEKLLPNDAIETMLVYFPQHDLALFYFSTLLNRGEIPV